MNILKGSPQNLKKAKQLKNYYLVMSGNNGDDYYLSYPTKLIKCNFNILSNLLKEIDIWGADSSKIEFIKIPYSKTLLTAGEGGGKKLWLSNKHLETKRKRIQAILNGKKSKIGISLKDILNFIIELPTALVAFIVIFKALNKKDKELKKYHR